MVEVMKLMATSFKRTFADTAVFSALTPEQDTVDTCLCWRPPDTQSKSRTVSCGVTAPFSWVLVHKVLLCPPRVYFPVLCKF